MPSTRTSHRPDDEKFAGFEPLSANFIYCPNQFFDACLPNCSRGALRLISFVLLKTLGWLDKDGRPLATEIRVSYRDLIDSAGISRDRIRDAVDEAISGNYVEQVVAPKAGSAGVRAQSGQLSLKWGRGPYTKDPDSFDGFFKGEGHRTPVPKSFFERVVAQEKLSVTRVVGTILRHTIGYQNQFGGRRQSAQLSYGRIQAYSSIRHPLTLSRALKEARANNYIQLIQPGTFDTNGGKENRAASYAPIWLEKGDRGPSSQKSEAASASSQKNEAESVRKLKRQPGQKTEADKKKTPKNISKQQTAAASSDIASLLLEWFDKDTIKQLVATSTEDEIRNQIQWLSYRRPGGNPAGLLRRAIEGSWEAPAAFEDEQHSKRIETIALQKMRQQDRDEKHQRRATESRKSRREELLRKWNELTPSQQERLRAQAIENCDSNSAQKLLHMHTDLNSPHWLMLKQLEQDLS